MIEIYAGRVFDLLNKRTMLGTGHMTGGYTMDGALEVPIKNTKDLLSLINTVMNMRASAGTKMNQQSSRSHCICHFKMLKMDMATKEVTRSIL